MMIEKIQETDDFVSKVNELVDEHNWLDGCLQRFLQKLERIKEGKGEKSQCLIGSSKSQISNI